MSSQVHKDVISAEEVQRLLSYMFESGPEVDDREKAYSKEPDLDSTKWLKELIHDICNRISVSKNFKHCVFWKFKDTFLGLHTDTALSGKNIVIPLEAENEHTFVFKNKWPGPAVKFYNAEDSFSSNKINLVSDYNKFGTFDSDLHSKYLSHVDKSLLDGLTIDVFWEWKVGDILVFDSKQVHCSASVTNQKSALLIWTRDV